MTEAEKQEDALLYVADAAIAKGHANDQMTAAIRIAHREGVSLRRIAQVSGMSHEQVRRMLAFGRTTV